MAHEHIEQLICTEASVEPRDTRPLLAPRLWCVAGLALPHPAPLIPSHWAAECFTKIANWHSGGKN